jgi:hypothetical protein
LGSIEWGVEGWRSRSAIDNRQGPSKRRIENASSADIMATEISFEHALSVIRSSDPEESANGLNVLFRRFVNRTETWEAFVTYFVEKPACDIPRTLIYYLAHIPWHPDIAWTGDETISPETREFGRKLFCERFGRRELIKLLECIDENGIDRGSIGQSVVAIIECLDESGPMLASVSRDRSLPVATREGATLIIAMRHGSDAIPILMELAQSGSETFAPKLISILRQKGRV